jgi:2'-5' RNA ligase
VSVRYGVALIPDPPFTAKVYRARQIICGQYASWAAEMHMLYMTVADFFQCPDEAVETLSIGLAGIAEQSRRRELRFPLTNRGVNTFPDVVGNIFLDFTIPQNPREKGVRELNVLHQNVIELLEQGEGVIPDLRFTRENYRPHITLMQHARLSPKVFESAVEFAHGVVRELQIPNAARAWRLALVRFESDAAGEDWDHGRWASDLRWQMLDCYPL